MIGCSHENEAPTSPNLQRMPARTDTPRDLRVAVIGAGMAGILSAIKLTEAGITDVTVYETADRVGGTWRENTYPGLSCDVPSHLYSYSFAPNPGWSRRFAAGPEIQRYFEHVAAQYDIERLIRFGDEVTACRFDDETWTIETASGHQATADVVIAATGVLHHPRYPDIEGLDEFDGALFHSSRWDHDVPIDGARVGIVGTGSTAIQLVCGIVDRVSKLSLFQRTAQWVLQAENTPYSDEERAAFRDDPEQLARTRRELTEFFDRFANAIVDAHSPEVHLIADLCRKNLEENVHDPELRERLRPDYQAACKRLIMSPNFYDAIQRPNAELVTEGIDRVEPAGVRTRDGRLHELDVLVLATGFRVDAFVRPMSVTGRNGQSLEELWAKRPNAYLSMSVPGFPNFFMLNGPNGPVGNFSLIEVAELQLGYIMQLIDELRAGLCREISATLEAMAQHEAARVEAAKNTVWVTGCRSWYLDDRGVPATWPWTFDRFREEMRTPKPEAFERV